MSEIPKDICAVADYVAERLSAISVTYDDMMVIASAILAERERCARIIEENDEEVLLRTGERRLSKRSAGNLHGLAYADAIRKGA